jgi:hypothetical protein
MAQHVLDLIEKVATLIGLAAVVLIVGEQRLAHADQSA